MKHGYTLQFQVVALIAGSKVPLFHSYRLAFLLCSYSDRRTSATGTVQVVGFLTMWSWTLTQHSGKPEDIPISNTGITTASARLRVVSRDARFLGTIVTNIDVP